MNMFKKLILICGFIFSIEGHASNIKVNGDYALNLISSFDYAGVTMDSSGKYDIYNTVCYFYSDYKAYNCLMVDLNRHSAVIQIISSDASRLMSSLENSGLRNGTDGSGNIFIKAIHISCELKQQSQASCNLTDSDPQ